MGKIAGLIFGILMILMIAIPVFGEPWQIASGAKIVSKDEVVKGDLLFNGQLLKVNGRIQGDLIIQSGDIIINGQIEGSVIGFTPGKLTVNGTVKDDLRVLAREVVLSGRVDRSVTIGAVSLVTTPSSRIGNGLYGTFAGVTLAGHINGPVDLTSFSSTVVGGQISGDFKGSLASITWEPPVEITGKVFDYTLMPKDPSRIKGVKIGEYRFNQAGFLEQYQPLFKLMLMASFVWFLGSLLFSLIFYRLFPRTAWHMSEPSLANFRRSLFIGAICFLGIPFLIQILSYTVVGIPIAVFLLLFYLLLLLGFSVPVYLWLGRLIFKSRLRPGWMIFWGALLMGLVTPILLVFQIILVMLGMGMIVGNIKPQFKERVNAQI
jgi:cytoskeletal protein CcmA (bactofilin family)